VLVAELQHRTRNLMGVVRSMADKPMRRAADLPDFRSKFRDRPDALARVQGVLSRLGEHDRVTFDEPIRTELAAHGALDDTAGRVTLSGPDGIRLRSSMMQTLAMGLHELATNVVKYGALKEPGGRLEIDWQLVDTGAASARCRITWQEHGVAMPPAGSSPQGSGQGRELLERALPYPLDADTSYTRGADGVCCVINPDFESKRMTEPTLRNGVILVVEDEYLLADDLCAELTEREALVVGPAATVKRGLELLRNTPRLDRAILDVNLRGEPVFLLADELIARKLPFVFTTGYDASAIPDRFSQVARCEKPVRIARVMDAIGRVTHA